MAQKRMFTMKICDSDAFLDMPLSTQCLYFHLCMRADDDGFIGNPKRIKSLVGASEDDLKLLIAKRFVLSFEDGVIVIKHWKMHNYIQSDRYTPTAYIEEKNMLGIKSNKAYTLDMNNLDTKCIQDVSTDLDLDLDQELDKEIDIDNKNNVQSDDSTKRVSKKEIDTFFEKVWKAYPNKKGKGQVSDAKKKTLYEIGEEEFNRAIERYNKELEKDKDWRKPQNGSTFFNSGYVDYLDVNYVASAKQSNTAKASPNNRFNNFGNQRDYSDEEYMDLEQKLLEKSKTIHK